MSCGLSASHKATMAVLLCGRQGLGLAPLPGSAAKNLTLTSVTPAVRAAALSPWLLETATSEPLKRSCEHMFLLHTSGPEGCPPGGLRKITRKRGCAVHHTAPRELTGPTKHPHFMGLVQSRHPQRASACCFTLLILIWCVFHRTWHLRGLPVYYLLKNPLYSSSIDAHCSDSEALDLGCTPQFPGALKTLPRPRQHPDICFTQYIKNHVTF